MYNIEEFDALKTKVLKYIMYKKRTEKEIRQKFMQVDENMLEEVIEYLKEAGYINDENYVVRAVTEFMNINILSIKEIKYKLYSKGIENDIIEKFIDKHRDMLENYEKECARKIYYKKISNLEENDIYVLLKKKGYKEESIKAISEGE